MAVTVSSLFFCFLARSDSPCFISLDDRRIYSTDVRPLHCILDSFSVATIPIVADGLIG